MIRRHRCSRRKRRATRAPSLSTDTLSQADPIHMQTHTRGNPLFTQRDTHSLFPYARGKRTVFIGASETVRRGSHFHCLASRGRMIRDRSGDHQVPRISAWPGQRLFSALRDPYLRYARDRVYYRTAAILLPSPIDPTRPVSQCLSPSSFQITTSFVRVASGFFLSRHGHVKYDTREVGDFRRRGRTDEILYFLL